MKTHQLIVAASILSLGVSTQALSSPAGEEIKQDERVKVEWVEPKKFTDVRSANYSNAKFREEVFAQLEKHLNKLSKDLPDGQTLQMKVKDLDLAGRIDFNNFAGGINAIDEVRIIRRIDIPRINFEYSLIGEDGEILKSEEVKLKDMNFLDSMRARVNSRAFAYEKKMLSDWFEDNLLEKS